MDMEMQNDPTRAKPTPEASNWLERVARRQAAGLDRRHDQSEDMTLLQALAEMVGPAGDMWWATVYYRAQSEFDALRRAKDRGELAIYARYGGLNRLEPDLRARVEAMLASPVRTDELGTSAE
jgi:hypothetical protein